MTSLKNSLEKIGEPEPNSVYKPIPSGFHSSPRSLKATIKAMDPPLIENWALAHVDNFYNEDWTEECQGIVTDGNFWYLVSNNNEKRAIYKFSLDFNIVGAVAVYTEGHHIGHPAFGNGKIYVPVEPPDEDDNARVWVLDTELISLGVFDLGENTEDRHPPGKMPWCAVNPWNSYLYSSVSSGVGSISAYDPNNSFSFKGTLSIEGEQVDKVQGGCFSKNGHLYLTSEETEDIRGYSALNGKFLGSYKVDYNKSDDEEMEGLTLGHITHANGISSYVHVIILDNDTLSNDDVYFKHFTVPDPLIL